MKRNLITAVAIIVSTMLILQASTFAKSGQTAHRAVSGPITIQSWLHAIPDRNGLSATVTGCFKLSGAFHDQGGGPNWTNKTYANTTVTKPVDKCHTWYPMGGFVFVPGVKTTDTTVYAVHTITGKHGDLFITFSGTYDLVSPIWSPPVAGWSRVGPAPTPVLTVRARVRQTLAPSPTSATRRQGLSRYPNRQHQIEAQLRLGRAQAVRRCWWTASLSVSFGSNHAPVLVLRKTG